VVLKSTGGGGWGRQQAKPGLRRPPTLERIDLATPVREALEVQAANPDETTRGR